MVFTGAYATFQWTKEDVFNVEAACINTSYPAVGECPGPFCGKGSVPFGFEQKLTNWTFTNNAIPLQRLNDVRLNAFAYGQTQGTISLDFVLANPWWLDMVGFGTAVPSGCADPYTNTWTIGSCAASKTIESMTIEIGQEQGATDQVRRLTGGIINSASLSTSIGETAKMSLDISYSNEAHTAALDTTPALQSINDYIPYTFAHGSLYYGAETCACVPDVCNLLAEVQDLDMTINQNGELLWGLGSSVAQSAYRKVFEVSGRAKLSHINECKLFDIYQQSKDTLENTGTGCSAQCLSTEAPGLQLVFENGIGTETAPVAGTRLIKINIKNISIKDLNLPIEPNEPIFEEINFQGREMDAKAITGTDQKTPPVAT